MNQITRSFSVLTLVSLLALPAFAGEAANGDMVSFNLGDRLSASASADPEVAAKGKEFANFAEKKVAQLNRNMMFTRDKMEITKLKDGTFRARYHQIDDTSLNAKVRRSQSQSSPFVAVLSYQERVFEAIGTSPDDFKNAQFTAVQITPNRHIFSYTKGAWK